MTRSFSAAVRRTSRLLRVTKLTKASRSVRKSMAGVMIKAALAPLSIALPTKPKSSKAKDVKVSRSLGVVLKQLRVAQSLMPGGRAVQKARDVSPRIPSGAQYLTRLHRSPKGSRTYKIYLPASQPKRPNGMILMLHGCGQSPDDFAVGTHMNALAEKHGLAIAYPAQSSGHNALSCWNWFKPGNQVRGAGEPAMLASLTRRLMKEFGLGRDSTFVAGLSAGGAMAAILADVYPDIFSAAGVHSGQARGAAHDVRSAMSAMQSGADAAGIAPATSDPVRRIVFHGDSDSTVHPSNAFAVVAAAVGNEATPKKVSKRSVRGRGYTRSDYVGADDAVVVELWLLEGTGHAWSGGRVAGSYTDCKGPDASAQMVRFFLTKTR